MAQAFTVFLCISVALFGASHAFPHGFYGGGMGGLSQLLMQDALQDYRTMCREISGSDAGYRKTVGSIGPALQCLAGNVNFLQFAMDVDNSADTVEARQGIIDKYCPAFNESVACFDSVIEGVAMCGNDKVSTIKAMYKKMIHNIVDVACKKNGQLLLEIRKPELRACIDNVKENVNQCKVSEMMQTTPISQFGEAECSKLQRSKTCAQEQISSCSTQSFMDIYDAIYQPILDAANCKMTVLTDLSENDI